MNRGTSKQLVDTPRDALERILQLCNNSSQYTRRTSFIHEIAMQGLGMTESQRSVRHERCEEKRTRLLELLETNTRGEARKIMQGEFGHNVE
jgi:hypothetical protein